MNRFQPVSFASVTEFLHYLPEEELEIVEQLRALTLECIPGVREKLAYNVPFYYRFSRICFIWPGAVPWGKKPRQGVEFGFCKGHLLSDPAWLDQGSRKEVFIKTFYTKKDIDRNLLQQLLYEAVWIDEEAKRK